MNPPMSSPKNYPMELSKQILHFLNHQGFVIVSTMDGEGRIHCSAKGVLALTAEARILIIDLYLRQTYRNLQRDGRMSITAVDESSFKGYTLQGRGLIIPREDITAEVLNQWEEQIAQRISRRIVHGVRSASKSSAHFEAQLPVQPQYLIELEVERIIDLSPPSLR